MLAAEINAVIANPTPPSISFLFLISLNSTALQFNVTYKFPNNKSCPKFYHVIFLTHLSAALKTSKIINGIAKVNKKSERTIPFEGLFHVKKNIVAVTALKIRHAQQDITA